MCKRTEYAPRVVRAHGPSILLHGDASFPLEIVYVRFRRSAMVCMV